ncbi:MAG TPA: hypothetical protein DCM54_02090 [Gammaproteobacteria bacterium]|nr:hypothetical protein [Gammaproteobacteria bacterium]
MITESDTLTVTVPHTGAELIAQVLQVDETLDFALLKVNGLNLAPVVFGTSPITIGETIWTATKEGKNVSLARGILQSSQRVPGQDFGVLHHSASPWPGNSLLLNDCGEAIGFNRYGPGSNQAIDVATIEHLLVRQNIKITVASNPCVSELEVAQEKADIAASEARQAQIEAERARKVAVNLESRLKESNLRNEDLVAQTQDAWNRAEPALQEATIAKQNAENIRIELETKTAAIQAETNAIMETLNRDRMLAEQRFEIQLAEQKKGAERRETILISVVTVLVVLAIVAIIFLRTRSTKAVARPIERQTSRTEMHNVDLAEYVLDGRDEDGIRYLLRISGDQLGGDDGIVIERNPKDSPYIINHSDVSRKHARMSLMQDRIFIEDLGSTNGTSVNGQAIEDKGPVMVNNGDQIIIGSVFMKLRVLDD